jgi:hypothetical protein
MRVPFANPFREYGNSFHNLVTYCDRMRDRYYTDLEDEHTEGATQCVVFTTTQIAPSGEERNGTWTSPTFSGWQGSWQQDGDHIQWYGFTDAAALATSEFGHLPSNTIISGEFNHFLPPNGATSSAGGWVAKRVEDCGTQPMSATRTQAMSAKQAAPESSNSDPAVKSIP